MINSVCKIFGQRKHLCFKLKLHLYLYESLDFLLNKNNNYSASGNKYNSS